MKVLDIGTGSGCIAISLAKSLPLAHVYALDVSKEALKVAKQNAKLNNVEITFIEADILNKTNWNLGFKNLEFNIIVSNPPYVRALEKAKMKPNVLDNEPHLALFVENDNPLVFYKAITNFASNNLTPNGELYFEINQYLGNETKQLLVDADFKKIELLKDLNGNDRILKGTKV
jgi:release factor glutamine methyltransferase